MRRSLYRYFLSASIAAVLFLSSAISIADDGGERGSNRATQNLSTGWRFYFGSVAESVTTTNFDDSSWQSVTVPHTWNRVGSYSTEGANADSNMQRGVGWYRLKFDVPNVNSDRRYFLQFDAVATIAEVWVNGKRAGEHKGAYSRFRFDITQQLKAGSNLIVVKADNSLPAPGSSTEHVLPLGGDYFVYGGIYRNVSLISTDSAQIDMLDYAGPGVYISTPSITNERAEVAITTRLRNLSSKSRQLTLVTTLLDQSGKTVASDTVSAPLAKSSTKEIRRSISLDNPRLWQGRTDPYLYRAIVELRDGERAIDRVEQNFGVRSFAFDANKGFFLNGKALPLHGVSRHQDRAGKGWALSPEDHAEDMAVIAEMGANSIRHAHYQHAQEWTEAADKAGMVVWAELPYTHETSVTFAASPSTATVENAKTQLIELIRQNFNHPSIVIWALGNEVDVANLVEMRRHGGKGELSKPRAFLKTLNDLAHQEDSGRVTSYADCCEQSPLSVPNMEVLTGATDVTAYNRYFGWYYGTPKDLGTMLDKFHAEFPKQPIGISEYGAGGAFSQHTDNPEGGQPNVMGRPHPEEYQSWYLEKNWQEIKTRPFLFGTWVWNMFDFGVANRAEGETTNVNDKGLVHQDRKQRKDAFYFYKANWSDEPTVYITSRRYTDRAYPVIDVRVYSNAPQASLTLNGKSLGDARCTDRICLWRNVHLNKGVNTVNVQAKFGDKIVSDSVTWNAPDPAVGLRVMAGTLTGFTTKDGERFGSDNFFVGGTAKVVVPYLIPNRKPKIVANTNAPELFESYREGAFRYELPLPDGKWKVTLHMFEPNADKIETRVFDVSANGKIALKDVKPGAQAGGSFKAMTAEFSTKVKGGKLVLDFVPKSGEAIVSAIVVAPQ